MKRKKLVIFCIISTCLMLSIPHIPAVTYNKSKKEIIDSFESNMPIKKDNQIAKNTVENQIDSIKQSLEVQLYSIQSNDNTFSFLRTIFNLILSLIILILNVLITILSIASGIINTVFSTAINLVVSMIKQLLNLSTLAEKILDVLASIASGLFGIFLNIVIGILSIIKNVIVDIISPNLS